MRDLKKLENELRFAANAGCDYTLLLEAADALAEARKRIKELDSDVIYIVTAGEYSDYGIVAATKDKATAERIKSTYNRDSKYEQAEIEEFNDALKEHEMNVYEVFIKNTEILYSVIRERVKGIKEAVYDVHQFEDYKRGKPDGTSWRVDVIAESECTAKKIAKDYVIQKEAEEQGLC